MQFYFNFSLKKINKLNINKSSFISDDSGMMSFLQKDSSEMFSKDNKRFKTKLNETIIINRFTKKGSTLDEVMNKEEINFFTNTSTKSNSVTDYNNKKYFHINKINHRGLIKNSKNYKANLSIVNKNFTFFNNIPKDIINIQNIKEEDDMSQKIKMYKENYFDKIMDENEVDENIIKINKIKDFQKEYLNKTKNP